MKNMRKQTLKRTKFRVIMNGGVKLADVDGLDVDGLVNETRLPTTKRAEKFLMEF